MYFHREIKTSLADEAYLLGCIMNNGTIPFFSILNLKEINLHHQKKKKEKKKERKKRKPAT